MTLPQPIPIFQKQVAIEDNIIKEEKKRTAGLVSKVDVATVAALREGQVWIKLRQAFLAIMPGVKAGWVAAVLWFWETL